MHKKYEMNSRIFKIIKDIANTSNPVTIKTLSDKYHVTARTIYNDMHAIDTFLEENNFEKVIIDSEGYIQQGKDFAQSLQYLYMNDFYNYKLSKEERIILASAILVSKTQFITISQIADQLYFSRTTIIKDLPYIKRLLSTFSLTLRSYPNKGVRVEGDEVNIRAFLLHVLMGYQETRIAAICSLITNHLIIHHDYLKIIQGVVTEIEKEYQISFKEDSFHKLVYYLHIVVERNLLKHGICCNIAPAMEAYSYAQSIMRYISQYCHIDVAEAECNYVSVFLKENVQYRMVFVDNRESIVVQVCTRKLIEDVSKELAIDLTRDYQLYENLSNHLTSIYHVSFEDNPCDNPVFTDIVDTQKRIIAAVKSHIITVENRFGRSLNEYEIVYIVIHFCAAIERYKTNRNVYDVIIVCNAGIGTSQFIKAKLQTMYNLHIKSIIPSHKVNNLTESSADLLISTVPIFQAPIDFVVISSHVSDEDYHSIGNKIRSLQKANHIPVQLEEKKITYGNVAEIIQPILFSMIPKEADTVFKEIKNHLRRYFNQNQARQAELLSPYLHQMLMPDFIALDVVALDWKDAIRKSAHILLEHGYIESSYITSILQITNENGPYYCLAPGVAIPHAGLEDGSYKTGMSLIRLLRPVVFGIPETDPIRYVITLSAVDHKLHLKALFHLLNLLANPAFVEKLDNAQTPCAMNQIIERYEYSLEDD